MSKSFSLISALVLAGAFGQVQAGEAEIRAAVKTLNAQAVVDSVKPSPAQGWSEVSLGGQIIYFSNDGKYLLQGSLVEVASRKNLTEASQSVARYAEMKKVDLKETIIFPAKGTPKHRVKIFTDIDCGYCRKLHQEMAQYNDLGIEVQYLWFPRAGVPSESSRKAIAVHCAKDQRKAMTDAKNGIDPGKATCANNPVAKDYELGQRIGVSGTPAIVLEDGQLLPGYMPAAALLAELDKRKAGK
jgi:thiol:disulfide interchange protein DsbC